MYGDNYISCMCQPMRILLETSYAPNLERFLKMVSWLPKQLWLGFDQISSVALIPSYYLSCSRLPDPPDTLIESALVVHRSLIKPLKGLEGATTKRYNEALNPRHCALSLVGEPIVYPYINEFVELLHKQRISSFIVTNGQHPDAIQRLKTPATQLYLSIDAPDAETLKRIGNPLFKDYWERLQESLRHLRHRTERTVARLTIVKGWNDKDVEVRSEVDKKNDVYLGNSLPID